MHHIYAWNVNQTEIVAFPVSVIINLGRDLIRNLEAGSLIKLCSSGLNVVWVLLDLFHRCSVVL